MIGLFLAACSGSMERPTEKLDPPTAIPNTSWIVTALDDGAGDLVNVLEGTEITAHFGEETEGSGYLSGFSGCNDYEAYYTIYEDEISIISNWQDPMENKCSERVMAQEEAYIWAFPYKWMLNEYVLELLDVEDNVLIKFRYVGPFKGSASNN